MEVIYSQSFGIDLNYHDEIWNNQLRKYALYVKER